MVQPNIEKITLTQENLLGEFKFKMHVQKEYESFLG